MVTFNYMCIFFSLKREILCPIITLISCKCTTILHCLYIDMYSDYFIFFYSYISTIIQNELINNYHSFLS